MDGATLYGASHHWKLYVESGIMTMDKQYRLLDLFCGAGGAAKGYQRAGFYVVGVDNQPQPHYVGDEFHLADAMEYCREHGAEYDAIHASPPCERYSECTPPEYRANHPDLIVSTRNALQSTGNPYVIENVENARAMLVNPILLCGSMFGLGVWRHRYFEAPHLGLILTVPCHHNGYPVLITGTTRRSERNGGRFEYNVQECRDASGIDWMTRSELDKAIPPEFTTFIGEKLMDYLKRGENNG